MAAGEGGRYPLFELKKLLLNPSCEAGKEWAMPILMAMSEPTPGEVIDAAAN